MPLVPGHQAEIIRANQKDEYYLSYLRASVSDILHTWMGPRLWLSWRKELEVLADVAYFSLTTFGGYQTLGEEYVGLIQTDPTRRSIPSLLRRMLMVGLQVGSPYILQALISHTERNLRTNPSLQLTAQARAKILSALPTLRYLLTLVQRCHLVAFYIHGAFYHVAKRLAGVHYVRIASDSERTSSTVYKILGALSVLQLLLALAQHIYTQYSSDKNRSSTSYNSSLDNRKSDDEDEPVTSGMRCALCLEKRQKTTATPCGHLYCWSCIHEWCATKTQCPICRQPCAPSRLIYLRNYDNS